MENSSLTPSNKQVGKLYDRLLVAARKSGFSIEGFQAELARHGTELEDQLLAILVSFFKKLLDIVTPPKAQDTGLVPADWKVISDDLETEINLANIDYSYCPVQGDEPYINGDTLPQRAKEVKAIGSLGFAKLVLDAQAQGKDIIPPKLQGKVYIVCSRTVLQDGDGHQRVVDLYWDSKRWALIFNRLDTYFSHNSRLPRSRE